MNPNAVNRIAFIDTRGQLCTLAPTGDDLRVLSDEQHFFQFPAWSPDSRRIAAIGGDRRSAGLIVAEDWDGAATTLYDGEDGPPIYLYWTPNGDEISFIAAEGYRFGLHFVQLDGERRVRAYGQPFFWCFAGSGNQFVAHTDGFGVGGDLEICTTQGNTSGSQLATPGRFQAPEVSADGELYAFAADDLRHGSQITVARTNGEIVRQLNHQGIVALGWSPHEPLLAFIHPTEDTANWYGPLHILDLATSEARVVIEDRVLAFFWSPDGGAIAYLTIGQPPRLPQREFGTYSPLEAQQRRKPHSTPQITLSIGVFELASNESKRLARFEPQPLFINQFLPFFDQYSRSHRIWSPDSRNLVLPLMAQSITPQIAIIPRDGSRARILTDGAMPFWSTR